MPVASVYCHLSGTTLDILKALREGGGSLVRPPSPEITVAAAGNSGNQYDPTTKRVAVCGVGVSKESRNGTGGSNPLCSTNEALRTAGPVRVFLGRAFA